MRLVLISDTHSNHDQATLPEGDVLIVAGDICNIFKAQGWTAFEAQIVSFNEWKQLLKYKQVLLIAGNHDLLTQADRAKVEKLLGNVTYLQDEAIEIERLKFYGSPWQPALGGLAFNLARGAELKEKWDLIPSDTDVLITHGPPNWILDTTYDQEHAGCDDLLRAVCEIKPKLHVFGHIHESYGVDHLDDTLFVNAALAGMNYQLSKPAWVVEVDKNTPARIVTS